MAGCFARLTLRLNPNFGLCDFINCSRCAFAWGHVLVSAGAHEDQKTFGCSGAEVRGDCGALADMGSES